jgi:hypothetical protein
MTKISENTLFHAMLEAMHTHAGTKSIIQWNNNTLLRCFLFDGYWYPLRATINHARHLNNESNDANTIECEKNLIKVLSPLKPYIKDIPIEKNQLPIANFSDHIEGRKRKWEAINAMNPNNAWQQLIQCYS